MPNKKLDSQMFTSTIFSIFLPWAHAVKKLEINVYIRNAQTN